MADQVDLEDNLDGIRLNAFFKGMTAILDIEPQTASIGDTRKLVNWFFNKEHVLIIDIPIFIKWP